MRSLVVAAALGLAPLLVAQGHPAGSRTLTFPNPTGRGSANLETTTWYPAQSAGSNAPLLPRPGGWPVVVFLHGFAALGSFYAALGEHLAASGHIAVLADTAQFSGATLALDGAALLPALTLANAQAGSFLFGALDTSRAALCGHSMGGGATLDVLAQNPGYRAGLCFAPVTAASASSVDVPLLVVHGSGDAIVPFTQGESNFRNATSVTGARCFALLDASASHTNVTGFLLLSATDRAVFAHAATIATGWLRCYLSGDTAGLEDVFGPRARTEPRLQRLEVEVRNPELWAVGTPSPGQTVTLRIGGEPGPAALLAAATSARVPTPFGDLLLDPATLVLVASTAAGLDRSASLPVPIPAEPSLVGVEVPFQALATVPAGPRLSGLWRVRIVP